jgi:predicted nucleic acid-binding protein
MRLLLDANVLLDCMVLEASGLPRAGKAASDQVLNLCDTGAHQGLVAWHTLPMVAYYHQRQHGVQDTAAMMDTLLAMLQVPTVTHRDAQNWRSHGISDFEDALQFASAVAGVADVIITRNTVDFAGSAIAVKTPEEFLAANP